jgi:hypothetical protein
MKKTPLILAILSLLIFTTYFARQNWKGTSPKQKHLFGLKKSDTAPVLKDGDIVFQSSKSGQSQAIQLATNSIYSHCGIVFMNNGVPYVLEAVQPVKLTPLSEWVTFGDDNAYKAKRLKDSKSLINDSIVALMKTEGMKMLHKNYDIYFNWSDKEIYCSELVYKIYERVLNLKVGKIKELKDYDLTHPMVRKIMKQRYGNDIPYEEPMISPGEIFESDLLIEVD